MPQNTQTIDPTSALAPKTAYVAPRTSTPQSDFERRGGASGAALTRKGMEDVHKRGQSVLFNGMVIQPGSPLPDDAQLAAESGDAVDIERVKAESRAEIERLRAQIAALEAKPADPAAPAVLTLGGKGKDGDKGEPKK